MSRKRKKTAAQYQRDADRRRQKSLIRVTPPEGVPIGFEKASIGARFGAQLLDLLITYGTLIGLLIFVGYNVDITYSTGLTLFALLSFLVRIPYYILTELVWNGRTIGKLLLKLRVISASGQRLEPHQIVVRNLMKEAEVFTPISLSFGIITSNGWLQLIMTIWLLAVLLVPVIDRRNQRLGDMIAGTYVVVQPKVETVAEVTEAPELQRADFVFEPHHLEHYGRFELQSLEKILRSNVNSALDHKRDQEVTAAITKKIGYTEKMPRELARSFLASFYKAQRAHLEARQMFGDKREDKHHRES